MPILAGAFFWLLFTGHIYSALALLFLVGLLLSIYNLTYDPSSIVWWLVLAACLAIVVVTGISAPAEWRVSATVPLPAKWLAAARLGIDLSPEK